MLTDDLAYMSESFLESFKYLGIEVLYVPLNELTSTKNKFAEFTFNYHEDMKVPLSAMFSKEANTDQDLLPSYTGRINANITLISTQLKANGIVAKERDAIDISYDGVTYQRFIITGFPKDPVMTSVFTKLKITDIEHAFKK